MHYELCIMHYELQAPNISQPMRIAQQKQRQSGVFARIDDNTLSVQASYRMNSQTKAQIAACACRMRMQRKGMPQKYIHEL